MYIKLRVKKLLFIIKALGNPYGGLTQVTEEPCLYNVLFKGHLSPFFACAAVWFLIRRNSFQSWYLWQKSFSIDLTRRLKIAIPTLKDCLVIYERFSKRRNLCFQLNTVENYAFLERGFSKRLETKTTFAPLPSCFERRKTKKRWEDEHPRCVYKLEESKVFVFVFNRHRLHTT